MNPVLRISAEPATSSARGSVRSVSRSTSTADGSWNAPTRFLPAAVLIPVLPPTAASTIASSVVGTCTTGTPRIHVAATNPARSVTAPPPNPTTTSERVSPASAHACQQAARLPSDLPSSASGTLVAVGADPGALQLRARGLGRPGERRRMCITSADRAPRSRDRPGQTVRHTRPDQDRIGPLGRDVDPHLVAATSVMTSPPSGPGHRSRASAAAPSPGASAGRAGR